MTTKKELYAAIESIAEQISILGEYRIYISITKDNIPETLNFIAAQILASPLADIESLCQTEAYAVVRTVAMQIKTNGIAYFIR